MIDIDELRTYLKIDKHALDQELEEHPMLLFKISEAYVQAAAERDMLKEQLATIDAKLDNKIRMDYGDSKYTEAMIKTEVQANKTHDIAMLKYLDAKKQAELLFALKEAFVSRGFMIRDLCSLYNANYFEEASVRGTPQTDRATYGKGRQRIAEARERR
jgi:alkylation response protein AidB-like acyl-CoA dehydrogenase